MGHDEIKRAVQQRYGQAELRVAGGEGGSCGGAGNCGCDPVSSNLYDPAETATLPEGAVLASLGCGNPTTLAELHEGEVVLDLGSGGGIDVLLSAQRVGPTGKAYGLDMTDEMLALARENQRKVLAEAFRVLKPGGRFAVSDVVVRGELPAAVRRSMELWVGCVAGALTEAEFTALLGSTGFEAIGIESTRIYEVGGRVMGAFVRARKPLQ